MSTTFEVRKHTEFIEMIEALKSNSTAFQSLYITNYYEMGPGEMDMLSTALAMNTTLKSLKLDCLYKTPADMAALADALTHNTTLQSLAILTSSGYGIDALGAALKINKTIESLDFNYSSIKTGAIVLANALEFNTTIRSLFLQNNNIKDEGAIALAKALEVNTVLQTLDISFDQIGDDGIIMLAKALALNTTQLRSLNLEGNNISNTGMCALAIALEHNKSLQFLDISQTNIAQTGVIALANTLVVNKTLQSLVIRNTFISDKTTIAIANMLNANTTLQSLCLGHFTEEGAINITNALKINNTLQSLEMDYKYAFGYAGRSLGTALKVNTTLQSLTIHYHTFPGMMIPVADALRENHSLKAITISCSQISTNDTIALAKMLEINDTLQSFILRSEYAFEKDVVIAVAKALESNNTLQALTCYSCTSISIAEARALADALKTNTTLQSLCVNMPTVVVEINEYLTRNKLWASGEVDTKPARQF